MRSLNHAPPPTAKLGSLGKARVKGLPAVAASRAIISAAAFEIDTVVRGLERLEAFYAYEACSAVFDQIPGVPALYARHLQQLLQVAQHPADAALIVKLMADEGIVGSRSTAGREGPVVGSPVRHSGSRPLLTNEILEHWASEIKPTCLLRWSRQLGLSPEQLEAKLQAAYCQCQAASQWSICDMAQVCHGSSSSSSRSSDTRREDTSNWSSNSSSKTGTSPGGSGTGWPPVSAAAASGTATLAAAARAAPAVSQDADAAAVPAISAATPVEAVTVQLQPFPAVVQSIKTCQLPCYVLSTLPVAVARAALTAVGLPTAVAAAAEAEAAGGAAACCIIQAATLEQCLQQLLQLQQQQKEEQQRQEQRQQEELTLILSSPNKAWLLQQHLSKAAPGGRHPDTQSHQPQQQQPDSAGSGTSPSSNPAAAVVRLQVGEWACAAPGLRAKTLAAPGLGLLSEVGLAELLGVADSDAVMDGIAWRE